SRARRRRRRGRPAGEQPERHRVRPRVAAGPPRAGHRRSGPRHHAWRQRQPFQRRDEVKERRDPRHRPGGRRPPVLPRRLPVAGIQDREVPAGRRRGPPAPRLPHPQGDHVMTSFDEKDIPGIVTAKRCGLVWTPWMGDWFTSWSPRNDNTNAEGPWDHWVSLALSILQHPMTEVVRPEVHAAVQGVKNREFYSEADRRLSDEELVKF